LQGGPGIILKAGQSHVLRSREMLYQVFPVKDLRRIMLFFVGIRRFLSCFVSICLDDFGPERLRLSALLCSS
jgi:hypothetical protein